MERDLETTDILETVTGSPSQAKAIKEEENRIKRKESQVEAQKPLMQQVKSMNRKI